ncbi:MAG: hypothetical protein KJP04_05585 [Arenicella sp.]|nr:hypothetical protein [Arenicella sp.]
METFESIVQWLATNEAAISAFAALIAIIGIIYGMLRYAFRPLTNRLNLPDEISSKIKLAKSTDTVKPLHDAHFSLAVLLFETLSKNEDDEFLASGITSEVIAHVTMVPDIRVSSRLSSFRFQSGQADIQKVAEQLNAKFVLTGSLRRSESRVFVIAQLTDVESDAEIWAQTYDRQVEDIFDVQHDIARCIVGTVLGEVKLAETLLAGSKSTRELDAWGLVQKAYHFWLTSFTPQGILDACDYLRQALKIDPGYATARAALAMLLAQQMTIRICEDYEACTEEARVEIEKAFQQAPNDIEVLENAGVTWQNLGESERANQALRRAIELAPLNLIARGYLALLLGFTGTEEEVSEARDIIQENFATAPKHPSAPYWHFFQAVVEQRLGNNTDAEALAKKSLIGQPAWVHNYFIIANACCLHDDHQGASKAVENAASINPYLTPQLYAENVYRITGSPEQSEPFIGGLKIHKFIE